MGEPFVPPGTRISNAMSAAGRAIVVAMFTFQCSNLHIQILAERLDLTARLHLLGQRRTSLPSGDPCQHTGIKHLTESSDATVATGRVAAFDRHGRS